MRYPQFTKGMADDNSLRSNQVPVLLRRKPLVANISVVADEADVAFLPIVKRVKGLGHGS